MLVFGRHFIQFGQAEDGAVFTYVDRSDIAAAALANAALHAHFKGGDYLLRGKAKFI